MHLIWLRRVKQNNKGNKENYLTMLVYLCLNVSETVRTKWKKCLRHFGEVVKISNVKLSCTVYIQSRGRKKIGIIFVR